MSLGPPFKPWEAVEEAAPCPAAAPQPTTTPSVHQTVQPVVQPTLVAPAVPPPSQVLATQSVAPIAASAVTPTAMPSPAPTSSAAAAPPVLPPPPVHGCKAACMGSELAAMKPQSPCQVMTKRVGLACSRFGKKQLVIGSILLGGAGLLLSSSQDQESITTDDPNTVRQMIWSPFVTVDSVNVRVNYVRNAAVPVDNKTYYGATRWQLVHTERRTTAPWVDAWLPAFLDGLAVNADNVLPVAKSAAMNNTEAASFPSRANLSGIAAGGVLGAAAWSLMCGPGLLVGSVLGAVTGCLLTDDCDLVHRPTEDSVSYFVSEWNNRLGVLRSLQVQFKTGADLSNFSSTLSNLKTWPVVPGNLKLVLTGAYSQDSRQFTATVVKPEGVMPAAPRVHPTFKKQGDTFTAVVPIHADLSAPATLKFETRLDTVEQVHALFPVLKTASLPTLPATFAFDGVKSGAELIGTVTAKSIAPRAGTWQLELQPKLPCTGWDAELHRVMLNEFVGTRAEVKDAFPTSLNGIFLMDVLPWATKSTKLCVSFDARNNRLSVRARDNADGGVQAVPFVQEAQRDMRAFFPNADFQVRAADAKDSDKAFQVVYRRTFLGMLTMSARKSD